MRGAQQSSWLLLLMHALLPSCRGRPLLLPPPANQCSAQTSSSLKSAYLNSLTSRRGQQLTLLQQAASLCNSQMCSRLLIVVLLLLPLQGDECGAQQSSWLPMVLPLRAKECGAMQSSWLLLLPHALLPRSRAQLLLHTLLP